MMCISCGRWITLQMLFLATFALCLSATEIQDTGRSDNKKVTDKPRGTELSDLGKDGPRVRRLAEDEHMFPTDKEKLRVKVDFTLPNLNENTNNPDMFEIKKRSVGEVHLLEQENDNDKTDIAHGITTGSTNKNNVHEEERDRRSTANKNGAIKTPKATIDMKPIQSDKKSSSSMTIPLSGSPQSQKVKIKIEPSKKVTQLPKDKKILGAVKIGSLYIQKIREGGGFYLRVFYYGDKNKSTGLADKSTSSLNSLLSKEISSELHLGPPLSDEVYSLAKQVADMGRGNTWSPWGVWSQCNSCRRGGLRYRHRYCITTPAMMCPGQRIDDIPCAEGQTCTDEMKKRTTWTPWSSWGSCTKTCGKGIQERTRRCLVSFHLCREDYSQSQVCKGPKCLRRKSQKTAMKPVKKTAKKTAKKPVKKTAKKTAKKPVKKTAKKPVKKAAKKLVKKPAKKSVKKKKSKKLHRSYFAKLYCVHNSHVPIRSIYWRAPGRRRITVFNPTSRYRMVGSFLYVSQPADYERGRFYCVVERYDGRSEVGYAALIRLACGGVNPCLNGGKCVEQNDSIKEPYHHFECKCSLIYTGKYCNIRLVDLPTILVTVIFGMTLIMFIGLCCLWIKYRCTWGKGGSSQSGKKQETDSTENQTRYWKDITFQNRPLPGIPKSPGSSHDYITLDREDYGIYEEPRSFLGGGKDMLSTDEADEYQMKLLDTSRHMRKMYARYVKEILSDYEKCPAKMTSPRPANMARVYTTKKSHHSHKASAGESGTDHGSSPPNGAQQTSSKTDENINQGNNLYEDYYRTRMSPLPKQINTTDAEDISDQNENTPLNFSQNSETAREKDNNEETSHSEPLYVTHLPQVKNGRLQFVESNDSMESDPEEPLPSVLEVKYTRRSPYSSMCPVDVRAELLDAFARRGLRTQTSSTEEDFTWSEENSNQNNAGGCLKRPKMGVNCLDDINCNANSPKSSNTSPEFLTPRFSPNSTQLESINEELSPEDQADTISPTKKNISERQTDCTISIPHNHIVSAEQITSTKNLVSRSLEMTKDTLLESDETDKVLDKENGQYQYINTGDNVKDAD